MTSDAEPRAFEPTDAAAATVPGMRFPLRAMLLVTSGAALLAAVLGPAYRAARPDSRSTLLAFWFAILATLLAYLGTQWRRHVRRLALAGPVRFALRRPDLPHSSFIAIVCAAVLFVFSISLAYGASVSTLSDNGPGPFGGAYAGAINGFLLIAAIHFLYRPFAYSRPILLGEDGVVVRRRVLPWGNFKRASWHHLLPNWLMLYGSERAYAAAAAESIKSDVEAFVRTKTRFEKDERKLAPGH
jgi:hypothetical protein